MYYSKAKKELQLYEIEFSKLYKRIMILETIIKAQIKNAVISTYKNDCFKIFQDFFNKKRIIEQYDTKHGNSFLATLNDQEINSTRKFVKLVDKLYLRHILQLILDIHQFRNENIQKNFYRKKPEKFGNLIHHRQNLVDLRNDIAHYNFNRYSMKQNDYYEALLTYEIHLGCNLGELLYLPNDLNHKPSVKEVLDKIYQLRPDLFDKNIPHTNYHCNKDRIIVDLYEDIAVLNGWKYNELKSPWGVIRAKYRHNEEKDKNESEDIYDSSELNIGIERKNISEQLSLPI